jgi:glutamate mutase epsilon subunit
MEKLLMKLPQPIYPYVHQLFGGKVEKKIFFLHIPKCGGTSLHHAIIDSFGLSKSNYEKSCFHLSASASAKGSEITGEPLMDTGKSSCFIIYQSLATNM